jgi:biotin carboxylase
VADALGLPSSSAEAAETARNKARMREALQARGVPQPRFRRVKGWEDLQAAASEIGYPLIYKPTGGAGSAGVYRVGTPQELRPAFERSLAYLSPGSGQFFAYYPFEFLVEEFMEGREVSVEGVVAHGRVLTAAVTDKWATPENFTEYRHAIPARLEPEVEREVLEVARAGVSAVGLDGCGFHAEVMITGEGCRVVEINGRLGGDMIASHLVPLATGVDLVKASLLAAMGREPDLAPSRTAGSCIRYLLAQREGVVTGWRGVSHLGLLPGVRLFCMDKYVGDTVLLPPKSFFDLRLCFVVTEGSDAGEAIGRADAALDGVECEIGTEDPALAPSQR